MITIDKSVGKGGEDRPIDVINIQNLINNNNTYTKLTKPLPLSNPIHYHCNHVCLKKLE